MAFKFKERIIVDRDIIHYMYMVGGMSTATGSPSAPEGPVLPTAIATSTASSHDFTANSIDRGSGSFLTDGWAAADNLTKVSAAEDAANDGYYAAAAAALSLSVLPAPGTLNNDDTTAVVEKFAHVAFLTGDEINFGPGQNLVNGDENWGTYGFAAGQILVIVLAGSNNRTIEEYVIIQSVSGDTMVTDTTFSADTLTTCRLWGLTAP